MTFRDVLNKMDDKDYIYYGNNYVNGVDSVRSCFKERGFLLDKEVISMRATKLPTFGNLIQLRITN